MKKVLAILLAIAMIAAMAACAQKAAPADETKTSGETTSTAGETVDNTADDTADTASSESYKIFLITMDQMDQYWTNIDAGCKKAAEELGNVEYQWTAPDVKDDAKQIEMINNAVANGANAILLAANGPEAVNDALKEASAAGVQIVYVDSPANFTPSVATFSTDNTAAGKTAGQTMIDQLAAKGITEGKIGIVSVNAATASAPLSRVPSLSFRSPSTATATRPVRRTRPPLSSLTAVLACSAATKAPRSALATRSRRAARMWSALASTAPTTFWN